MVGYSRKAAHRSCPKNCLKQLEVPEDADSIAAQVLGFGQQADEFKLIFDGFGQLLDVGEMFGSGSALCHHTVHHRSCRIQLWAVRQVADVVEQWLIAAECECAECAAGFAAEFADAKLAPKGKR